ncbi:hypothetical protein QUB05_14730 [Microcoleus sp. F10-C6]|uniref:hypothetical protein n=1 Tax=unclassified Microcoleus TaxID=2642155 RepID=UPI002FD0B2B2
MLKEKVCWQYINFWQFMLWISSFFLFGDRRGLTVETRLGPCDGYLLTVTADFLASFLRGGKEKERRFFGSETAGEGERLVSTLPWFSPSAVAFKLESVSQALSTFVATVIHLPVAGSR